jgi:hypothetical protein
MKSNLTAAMFCALAISVFAQDPPSVPTLTGIINVPGYKAAVFERTARINKLITLREGERFEGIEISQINPQTLKVNARIEGSPTTLGFKTNYPSATGSDYGLVLENANLDPLLRIYSEISKRTMLRPAAIPALLISTSVPGSKSGEVVKALERTWAEKGIVTIPDGDKFVIVVPKAMAGKVKAGSKDLKSSDVKGSAVVAQPKEINFVAAPTDQVMAIYAEFAGRKLDPNHERLPASIVSFQNVTPLTRDELLYGLDTVLALNGLKLVPIDGGLLRAEMISEK